MTDNNNRSPLTAHRVLLVGGGTGGHIFPLYNLAESLIATGAEVHLTVNDADLDRKIVKQTFTELQTTAHRSPLAVHYLKAHKLHYHLSAQNLLNPFRIIASFWRARKMLKQINPDAIFFKGGFVGLPILIAAKFLMSYKGKIYLHESDTSSGALTNFFGKYADQTFSNFGDNATPLFYWPSSFEKGGARRAEDNPQILIFGGSQGAQFINELILNNVDKLCEKYRVVLVTGPGKNHSLDKRGSQSDTLAGGFKVHEFLDQKTMIEQINCSSLVIARAGASLFQVFAAQKKCIAIPLPSSARNHQMHNAQYFSEKGLCYLLEQNKDTQAKFLPMVEQIMEDNALGQTLSEFDVRPKADRITKALLQ